MRHDPAQPPQDVSHVRAEDTAVAMALVDDDQTEPAEESGPSGVPRQQGAVQHVRGGQQVPGVAARPGPLGVGRVAVEGGRLHAGQAERADRRELVGRERLGGRDIQHSVARQHRGERGQQVAERLARSRGGGDDHVPARPGVVRCLRLVTPRSADAAVREGADDLGGNPSRPGHLPAGPGRDVLDVHRAARPRVIEQDAQRAVLGPDGGVVRGPGAGSCHEHRRPGRGNRGDGRHSFPSVTSRRPMLRDFACVGRWGMPGGMISYRHDTGAWLNAAGTL